MARLAIVISPAGLHVYGLKPRHAEPLPLAAEETSAAAILLRHAKPGDTLYLYTDLAEESYSRSELPAMWSSATRQQLLERRLGQQYPDHAYRGVLLVGGTATRPPRMASLIGITRHPAIDAVCEAALARGLRLAGMWPLSLLLAAHAAGVHRRHPFLLTVQLPSGVRHVLVQKGVAVFSRLSQAAPAASVPDLVLDAQRTAQYLGVQGWRSALDDLLALRVWHSPAPGALPPEAPTVAGLQVQEVRAAPDFYAVALAHAAPSQGQLLPPGVTLTWRAAQLGRWALATSAACMLAAGGWAGWAEYQVGRTNELMNAARASEQAAARETARILATAKGNLSEAALAQAAVSAWTRIIKNQPDHGPPVRALAGILADFPQIRLERVAWRAAPPLLADLSPAAFPDPEGIACTAAALAAPAVAATPAADKQPAVVLSLRVAGQLPVDMPLRERVRTQEAFIARLKALGWQVEVVKPVIDQGQQAAYSGVLGAPARSGLELCLSIPGT